jgi:cell shape-determining protein MreD
MILWDTPTGKILGVTGLLLTLPKLLLDSKGYKGLSIEFIRFIGIIFFIIIVCGLIYYLFFMMVS